MENRESYSPQRRVRIFIVTDMEGCAGILNHDDWVVPSGRYYDLGRRFLTDETNAAIAGFFAGGITEAVVCDGHGAGGIDPELLDQRVELLRGAPHPVWPFFLDDGFDAIAWVGQHAKAGTPGSHISHTGWFNVIDMSVNGISIGEYGQMALCARELGIPAIFAAGEEALAREAEALTPGVITAAVKRGILPDGLEHLSTEEYRTAKLSALHKSPAAACRLIREQAFQAARKFLTEPESFHYPRLEPPIEIVTRLRMTNGAPAHCEIQRNDRSFIAAMNSKPEIRT